MLWLRRRVHSQERQSDVSQSGVREEGQQNEEPGNLRLQQEQTKARIDLTKTKDGVFIVLVVVMIVAVIESIVIMPRLLKIMDGVAETTQTTNEQMKGLKKNLEGVGTVTTAASLAISNSSQHLDKTLEKTDKVLDNLAQLEKRTDYSLNAPSGVLSNLSLSLEVLQGTMTNLQEQIPQVGVTLKKSQQTLTEINTQTLPAVTSEIATLDATTAEAHGAMKNLKQLMGHGNHIVAHYDKAITKKIGVVGTIGKFAEGFAEQVVADIVALKATGH